MNEKEKAKLNGIYSQRNALAIAAAKFALMAGLTAGRRMDENKPDWDEEWCHVLFIDLPDGSQVSWHMSPAEVPLLDGLPMYNKEWDGKFQGREKEWVKKLPIRLTHKDIKAILLRRLEEER